MQGLEDAEAEEHRAADAEDAVGAAGQAAHVVDERDAHDLHDADGHDEQIVTAQVDDGPRHHQGEQGRRTACHRHGQEDGPVVQGVQDGRAVRPYGEEGGMPHMEDAGLPQDDVERKGQQGIQADADAHVRPVGIGEQRQEQQGRRQRDDDDGAVHSLSAVLSPRMPVGRMIRMRISTVKAMASFQAMAM